jgi:glycosyltransferase involved in cell wall biosynthesis
MMEFSVLISVYSQEDAGNFSRSLSSIIDQTSLPTEIVLVKDGPLQPELEDVIVSFSRRYSFLKVIPLAKNVGLGEALRIGLEACSHDIVIRMDSDDICRKDRFEIQIEYLANHPEVAVLGGNIEEFEVKPGDIGRIKKVPCSYAAIKRYSKFRCPVNHPTAAFKKSAIMTAGSYRDMPFFEDYYLWLRVLQKGYIIENLSANLVFFRVSKKMMTRRHGINYFKKEIYFFNRLRTEQIIPFSRYIALILLRLPFRLLPLKISFLFYHQFLRSEENN